MKTLISAIALAAGLGACAHDNDLAMREAMPSPATSSHANKGQVTIAGIEPSRVLGAIDTSKIVKHPDVVGAGDPAAGTTDARPGSGKGITVEGVEPAAVLAAIDTSKLVGDTNKPVPTATPARSAEVQAVVSSGNKYSTRDLALAQLAAVRKGGG